MTINRFKCDCPRCKERQQIDWEKFVLSHPEVEDIEDIEEVEDHILVGSRDA